jgi:lipopolysaccharide biosynthesis glycosyltransferase
MMITSPSQTKNKSNAIVVCCTPSWLPAAACTLKSCADQGGAEVADFYVVAMGLTDKDRKDFQTFQSINNFSATIVDGILPQRLVDIATKRFSAAAFLRLTLDQILDAGYRRVLYLDSDILALQPIGSMFDIDLQGKCLGAVEDYQSLPSLFGDRFNHTRSIGLKPGERYFNSGVLLFNWPETLKRRMLPQCVDRILALGTSKKKFNFPDQDIMNLVFAGQWHRLPMAYNLMSVLSDYFPKKPIFRHFTKDHKPWQNVWMPGFSEFKKQYQAMLQNSPWASAFKTKMTRIAPIESLGIMLRRMDTASRDRYLKHLES